MKTRNFRIILIVCLLLFAGTAIKTKAQKAELVVQTGHSFSVTSAAFSPNGKTLASGSNDGTIRLWDVATGAELRTLKGHSLGVNTVAFSPGGKTLVSGGEDTTVRLWDINTGAELRALKWKSGRVTTVAFSPDGKMVAFGGWNDTIRLWDVTSGAELRAFTGHNYTNSVAFSPDGRTLASGGIWDRTIRLWDVASGAELRALTGHSSGGSVAFSPDGKTLASGSAEQVVLWDVVSGVELRAFTGHSSGVLSVAFSPDGKMLASGSVDRTIRLWDVASGAELRALTGHFDMVSSVAFSLDGKRLASGSFDKTIRLWDVASGAELRALTEHSYYLNSVAFSPDGKTLGFGGLDKSIKLWDLTSGVQLRALTGQYEGVRSVAFSPDGKTVGANGGSTVKLWDLASGAELRTFPGHSVAFSPNGKTLASGSSDQTVRLWDVASGAELRALKHDEGVTSFAFSPDGKTLASTGFYDQTIRLWDVASGATLRALTGFGLIKSVAFSPDGKMLASGSSDKTIRLWDVASGAELRELSRHSDWVSSVAFSPDGKTLASGSWDHTIRLWNVRSGAQLLVLTGHYAKITSVAFSPNGKMLVSVSWDKTIKLWDVMSGTQLASLVALDDRDWVVVTPDYRFDTNKNLDNIEGLHWVMSDAPLTPLPLEIFMRDYYEPQLLPRLIKCNEEKNCQQEFKPVRDISKLNRVQPPVRISNVSLPDAEGYTNVTVELGKGVGKHLVNGKESTLTTGVYDLRLFRDGQMVGSWPSDGAEKVMQLTAKDVGSNEGLTGEQRFLKELRDWQQSTEVKPDNTIKVDPKTGMLLLPSFRVKLPKGKDVSEIEFSAYAFNEDRVKSQTDIYRWTNEQKAKLPRPQPVKPRAYVIAVGVNAYENSDFDLEFAADDARRMAEVLTEKLNATGQYEKVIPVTLISDYETRGNQKTVTQKQATKDNFRAVLERLAGRNADSKLLAGVKNAEQLQRATPDDLVIIMYSSHGYADRAGNFYFIPYDTGPGRGKVFTESVRRHSISSEELSLWLRDLDAGEMVMIVDACHSTAAVAGQDFKPGPMGSRGLGQLSYDKGMRILTATQSDNVAWEYPTLRQGMLTYALLRDGVEARQADFKPKDQTITIAEWLAYGVERVPRLYEEVLAGKVQSFGLALSGRPKLVVIRDGKPARGSSKELEEVLAGSGKSGTVQQPSLFDFTRRKRPVVLAKTN